MEPAKYMQLPEDFLCEMEVQLGKAEAEQLAASLNDEASVSVRLNRRLFPDADLSDGKGLLHLPLDERVPWCERGWYLRERPVFTLDPLFHAGAYYVQEASSMYLWKVLRTYLPKRSLVALDLCAAPGGKSTLTLDAIPAGSLLVSNEIVWQRAQILRENMVKWGSGYSIITSCDSERFASIGEIFDLIVCDAPCSGEGMFRKDANAIAEWSLKNVEMCVERQREILRNAWACLKPGGLLVYSTCTFNRHENEENVDWLVDTFDAEWLESRRFMPHLTRGEGLFMAALKKGEGDVADLQDGAVFDTQDKETRHAWNNRNRESQNRGKGHQSVKVPADIKGWLVDGEQFSFHLDEKTRVLTAFPIPYIYIQDALQRQHIQILHAGIPLAVDKGNVHKGSSWQPLHSLALSGFLNREDFAEVELSREEALDYLRLQGVTLAPSTPRGFVLVTYRNCPLGFAKHLGNRSNNLYPSEWRIRMNTD